MDVHIDTVKTQVTVTEGVGALSPEDVQKIVQIVMEQLDHQKRNEDQRKSDVSVGDRAYQRKGL